LTGSALVLVPHVRLHDFPPHRGELAPPTQDTTARRPADCSTRRRRCHLGHLRTHRPRGHARRARQYWVGRPVSSRGYTVATFSDIFDLVPISILPGRGGGIRTHGPSLPKRVRYQAAPHPVYRVVQPTRPPGSRVSHRSRPAKEPAPGTLGALRRGGACGRSSMVEPQPSKLAMPVRSRSPAPHVFVVDGLSSVDSGR
jgi:hypothetical protein